MITKRILSLILLLIGISTSALAQQKSNGKLFIIGGGSRSDALIKDMVTAANLKANDYIVVLPMASEQPDTGYKYISQQLVKHTSVKIRNFDFAKHSANTKWTDSLANAKLIYILGGDQNRFMTVVLGTPIYNAIHNAYQKGATVGGTSAGAAVMSKYMITGKQLLATDYKETFNQLLDKNVELAEGLGLLKNTIIDQHFIKRNRYNRLISALSTYPNMIMVGIDEATAIVVQGNKARVTGDGQVVRMAKKSKIEATSSGLIKAKNIQFGLFTHEDVFEILP